MILDTMDNAVLYFPLHRGLAKAFAFLGDTDLGALPLGRTDICGDDLFAMAARPSCRDRAEAKLEVHRRYIDIQVTLSGHEVIGWKALRDCTHPDAAFSETDDFGLFGDASDSWLALPPGQFMVFWPQDAHAPLCGRGLLHKVVLKLAVDWKGR